MDDFQEKLKELLGEMDGDLSEMTQSGLKKISDQILKGFNDAKDSGTSAMIMLAKICYCNGFTQGETHTVIKGAFPGVKVTSEAYWKFYESAVADALNRFAAQNPEGTDR